MLAVRQRRAETVARATALHARDHFFSGDGAGRVCFLFIPAPDHFIARDEMIFVGHQNGGYFQ
jgi:hypothetical protein